MKKKNKKNNKKNFKYEINGQKNTEQYNNLQIRVAGYSAFWIDLPKETQDSIISRTEHNL